MRRGKCILHHIIGIGIKEESRPPQGCTFVLPLYFYVKQTAVFSQAGISVFPDHSRGGNNSLYTGFTPVRFHCLTLLCALCFFLPLP